MEKIKDAFWQDYESASDLIKGLDVESERYQAALEERDRLRNELLKLKQIESENEREKIRNGISIITFAVSTVVSVCAIRKTFKFDQVATVTSTLGRNILNGVVPKMFRR